MADIFISYSRTDYNCAKGLADLLRGQGWSVWWDRQIPPGKTYDQVIEEALDAARCVVVIWSRESVASSWVKNEASEGMQNGRLIPVLIEDVKIPLEFRRLQAASFLNWDNASHHTGIDHLVDSVTGLLGRPRPKDDSASTASAPKPLGTPPIVTQLADAKQLCSRCGKEAAFIPMGGRDLRNLLSAVLSGVVLLVSLPILGALPKDGTASWVVSNVALVAFFFMLVAGYFGLRKQDVISCNSCGHRDYVMVERSR